MPSLFLVAATACQQLTGTDCSTGFPNTSASGANLHHILQIVFAIFAVVAVLIVIIAAMGIVTAGGDPNKVAKERTNIIYALVGLIVALLAEVLVSTVLGWL